MLRAIKKYLIDLSTTQDDQFASKIKSRLPAFEGDAFIVSLRNFIRVIPEMISQIRIWMDDPRIPSKEKNLYPFMLTYLYRNTDFLPASEHGLFGYLDDAYFVGQIFIRIMNYMDYGTRNFQYKTHSLETDIPRWLELTRLVIPRETDKIDRLIEDLTKKRLRILRKLLSAKEESSPFFL